MKKATKKLLIGIGSAAALIGAAIIARKGMQMLKLLNKLDLSSLLSEQYPEVGKWTISSAVFPNTVATTVYCPPQLLTDNPDAEEKLYRTCLEKVPELAEINFSLKLKASKR